MLFIQYQADLREKIKVEFHRDIWDELRSDRLNSVRACPREELQTEMLDQVRAEAIESYKNLLAAETKKQVWD
jgi:hypothetical protein